MTRSLKGIRLVVTGFELEQQEHRGIAVFTKGLLRALKGAGAEIWLLTEIQPSTHDIKKAQLPKAVQERVNASRILDICTMYIHDKYQYHTIFRKHVRRT